jgi:hypothetical protein
MSEEKKETKYVETSYELDWNPSEISGITSEATDYADKWKANAERRGNFMPTAFLGEGRYVFRIRPYRRKKDNSLSIIRRIC